MQANREEAIILAGKQSQNKPQTQAEALRALLNDLELRIARLQESNPKDALQIPDLFDQVEEIIERLHQAGGSTSSEDSHLETLKAQFNSKRHLFLSRIGGAAVLVKSRQSIAPPEDHWWWFVDQTLIQERRALTRRILAIGGVIALFLIGLFAAYQSFLKPDPTLQASVGFQNRAENLLIEKRYKEALVEVNQALELTTDNPDLFVLRGVLIEILGQPALAREDFDTALKAYPEEDDFYMIRAGYYVMTEQAELALADADKATELNPDSAMGFIRKAQAYELLGEVENAIENYELASDAAERTGNPQLQVIARMSMAQLMQSAPLMTPEVTE